MLAADRAALYAAFAEVLAAPPAWLCLPGREWPLFELGVHLLPGSPALLGLSTLPAETPCERLARYEALFGSGRPRFWLHESGYLSGRILGGQTFNVARFYRNAALEVNGGELPDHAALEMSFLAYLTERGDLETERAFLDQHVLRWLPGLGRSLSGCDDPLYATLGQFLADFLARVTTPAVSEQDPGTAQAPRLAGKGSCTLCGFCTQRCPAGALYIHETEATTSLVLNPEKCNGCGRCIPACQDGLLILIDPIQKQTQFLFESERVPCSSCGEPTVSRAEINYMIQKIGHPDWLELCLTCRVNIPLGGNK